MFDRFSYWVFVRSSGAAYRFQQRFTVPGMCVIGGVVVMALLGMDTEQSFAYQSLSFLIFLILFSLLFAPFFRGRFVVRRQLPRFGSVNESFSYQVTVRNETDKPQGGMALLDRVANFHPSPEEFRRGVRRSWSPRSMFMAPLWPGRATLKEAEVPVIPPGGEETVVVKIEPKRRGILRLGGGRLSRTDPLGLVRGFVPSGSQDSVVVLPKRYPVPPLNMSGVARHQPGGVALASSVGDSKEFVFLRDYRRGDPLRHVHWKSWARTGKPIVKEFQNEFFVRHALILDTFPGKEDDAVFEEAVSVAASYACTVQTQESLLDLMFIGQQAYCFTAGRGLAQTEQILEVLASVDRASGQSFSTLRDLVMGHASRLSGCICVLQSWDEERRDFLRQLEAIGVPLMVLLVHQPGDQLDRSEAGTLPERLFCLEVGRIEKDLAMIEGQTGGGE